MRSQFPYIRLQFTANYNSIFFLISCVFIFVRVKPIHALGGRVRLMEGSITLPPKETSLYGLGLGLGSGLHRQAVDGI